MLLEKNPSFYVSVLYIYIYAAKVLGRNMPLNGNIHLIEALSQLQSMPPIDSGAMVCLGQLMQELVEPIIGSTGRSPPTRYLAIRGVSTYDLLSSQRNIREING